MEIKYSTKIDCINAIHCLGQGVTVIVHDNVDSSNKLEIYKPLGRVVEYSEADHFYLLRQGVTSQGDSYYSAFEIVGRDRTEFVKNLQEMEEINQVILVKERQIAETEATIHKMKRGVFPVYAMRAVLVAVVLGGCAYALIK